MTIQPKHPRQNPSQRRSMRSQCAANCTTGEGKNLSSIGKQRKCADPIAITLTGRARRRKALATLVFPVPSTPRSAISSPGLRGMIPFDFTVLVRQLSLQSNRRSGHSGRCSPYYFLEYRQFEIDQAISLSGAESRGERNDETVQRARLT